jgi:hypothetical protein
MHDTRVEVHEAFRAAAKLGLALLSPEPDDSHHSFTWSAAHRAFVQRLIDGRFRVGVRIADLTLLFLDAEDRVITEFALRASSHDLVAIASLYANAAEILERLHAQHPDASPVRLWPHHFDVATLIGGTLGVGFLAGDDEIDEPYWYVYDSPMPDTLPELPAGEWHRGTWTGAVLTGNPDAATIERFLAAAIAAVKFRT